MSITNCGNADLSALGLNPEMFKKSGKKADSSLPGNGDTCELDKDFLASLMDACSHMTQLLPYAVRVFTVKPWDSLCSKVKWINDMYS